ncbi:hypothetical protein B0H11DRAFT_2285951 [Mycena galericulata]|nr:hypothetical protein B0H11DRAFT_2285951 [Mycena galericulata]
MEQRMAGNDVLINDETPISEWRRRIAAELLFFFNGGRPPAPLIRVQQRNRRAPLILHWPHRESALSVVTRAPAFHTVAAPPRTPAINVSPGSPSPSPPPKSKSSSAPSLEQAARGSASLFDAFPAPPSHTTRPPATPKRHYRANSPFPFTPHARTGGVAAGFRLCIRPSVPALRLLGMMFSTARARRRFDNAF